MDPGVIARLLRREAQRLLVPLLEAAPRIGRDQQRWGRNVGHQVILEEMAAGKVYLVGAGPGDPGLVTLRAVEILQQADVVLYDYLANPAILGHCPPQAIRVSLGKHGSGRIKSQHEINELLAAFVSSYRTIVRLKNGDPMVFGRAGEELSFLKSHGIEFEIVPGVTAAIAAASYAGIPITHRDEASAVALVTGHEDAEKTDSTLDFAALARFPGTLVFYMGVTTVEHWSRELMAAGKPAATPVAILRRVSLPDQQRINATLGDVAAIVKEHKLRPPVVFVIGEVAAHDSAWPWFAERPLFGQRVLVTRPAHQADDLARPLAELGAEVLYQPAIEIYPPALASRVEPSLLATMVQQHPYSSGDWSAVDRVLDLLDRFDWVVFSSGNGVRFLLERAIHLGRDLRIFGPNKLAAIGPGTADELARYHLRADLVPDEFRAESLALALKGGAAGKRFLLVRASRGREVLAEELTKAGGIVEQVIVYESVDVETPSPEIAEQMAAGRIDWTTVTSSAIARSLVRMFGDSLRKTRLASISPITSATLRELGYEPAAEAKEYTMAGMVEAIRAACTS
jgi:uroporphyrinogen III methyltransferase/synthase